MRKNEQNIPDLAERLGVDILAPNPAEKTLQGIGDPGGQIRRNLDTILEDIKEEILERGDIAATIHKIALILENPSIAQTRSASLFNKGLYSELAKLG